jgi:metal-responsive CopG/Arc/MetJ family transcriptional regulator
VDPLKVISLKVDENLLQALNDAAKREGVSKSEIIRRALVRYLEEIGVKRGEVRVRYVVLA